MEGIFKAWVHPDYGFIQVTDNKGDVFIHISDAPPSTTLSPGDRVLFTLEITPKGRSAKEVIRIQRTSVGSSDGENLHDEELLNDDIEELDTTDVNTTLLEEIASWKREAKAEDSYRYFWHVREVDQIIKGNKYFIIGRKGSGKTAICEHFYKIRSHDIFADKLSFKQFPFNELYEHSNKSFTSPNQYITLWKYLIYSTICRLMLKNEALDSSLRDELSDLFGENISLSRRVRKWVGKEFGLSLFGLSIKVSDQGSNTAPDNWIDYVDYVEDLLAQYAARLRISYCLMSLMKIIEMS
jgi:cold shock CspA family protein